MLRCCCFINKTNQDSTFQFDIPLSKVDYGQANFDVSISILIHSMRKIKTNISKIVFEIEKKRKLKC